MFEILVFKNKTQPSPLEFLCRSLLFYLHHHHHSPSSPLLYKKRLSPLFSPALVTQGLEEKGNRHSYKMTVNDNISNHDQNGAPLVTDEIAKPKDFDSSSGKEERLEDAQNNEEFVDITTERAILRKLDYRIIPMVMWVYLMNMMDRGMLQKRKQQQDSFLVSLGFIEN